MLKRKIALTLSIAFISAMAVISTVFVTSPTYDARANSCSGHVGYHYDAVEAGYDTPGSKEFWVCCKCHEVFLTTPSSGYFEDHDFSLMSGGLDSTHPAYLPPSQAGGSNGDYWYKDPFED